MKTCLECNDPIIGRIDKKFCTVYCKSAFHEKNKKLKEDSTFVRVSKQLKLNRKVLKSVSAPGASQVMCTLLTEKGFDQNFYTHTWTSSTGNLYHFCFEHGFRIIREVNKPDKYMLIFWQDYMNTFSK